MPLSLQKLQVNFMNIWYTTYLSFLKNTAMVGDECQASEVSSEIISSSSGFGGPNEPLS
jgi:hypothetical protein